MTTASRYPRYSHQRSFEKTWVAQPGGTSTDHPWCSPPNVVHSSDSRSANQSTSVPAATRTTATTTTARLVTIGRLLQVGRLSLWRPVCSGASEAGSVCAVPSKRPRSIEWRTPGARPPGDGHRRVRRYATHARGSCRCTNEDHRRRIDIASEGEQRSGELFRPFPPLESTQESKQAVVRIHLKEPILPA